MSSAPVAALAAFLLLLPAWPAEPPSLDATAAARDALAAWASTLPPGSHEAALARLAQASLDAATGLTSADSPEDALRALAPFGAPDALPAAWRPEPLTRPAPPLAEALTIVPDLAPVHRAALLAYGAVSPSSGEALARILAAWGAADAASRAGDVDALVAARDALAGVLLAEVPRLAIAPVDLELCGTYRFSLDADDDQHACDTLLTIDLGGNDNYSNNAGGLQAEAGAALAIDAAGDDEYYATGGVRAAQGGVVGDGSPFAEWPSFEDIVGDLAMGFLFDAGGSDVYRARIEGGAVTGGASGEGLGTLIDLGGDDVYDAELEVGVTTGSGQDQLKLGGLLYDGGGEDRYLASFVGPSAFGAAHGGGNGGKGALVDVSGPDRYHARGDSGGFNGAAYLGGTGFLLDGGGDDAYDVVLTGNGAANGAGNYGEGILVDLGGNDTYFADLAGGAANGATYLGLGILVDSGGTNSFEARNINFGIANGAAVGATGTPNPFPLGLLLAGDGDDTYVSEGISMGAGLRHAIGALVDAGGRNSFDTPRGHLEGGHPQTGCALTYDPLTDEASVAFQPAPTYSNGAVRASDDIYVLGGFVNDEPQRGVWRYLPGSDRYEQVGELPGPMNTNVTFTTGAPVWNGSHVLVFGVEDSSGPHGGIAAFQPSNGSSWRLPAELPAVPTEAAVATPYGIYIFGSTGPAPHDDAPLDTYVAHYDDATGVLTELPIEIPDHRSSFSAVWDGEHIHLLGGYKSGDDDDLVAARHATRFDPALGTIVDMPTDSGEILEAAWVWNGTRAIGFLRVNGPGMRAIVYDPATDAFDPAPGLHPHASFSTAVFHDGIFLAFGGYRCSQVLTQGAGSELGVGLLTDRGSNSTFRIGAGVTGQGVGLQGVGILLRPDEASESFYATPHSARALIVSGGGATLRVDEGLTRYIAAPPELPCATSESAAGEIRAGGRPVFEVRYCSHDQATTVALMHPTQYAPIGPAPRPGLPCASIDLCRDTVGSALGPSAVAWLGSDRLNTTVSGGFTMLAHKLRVDGHSERMVRIHEMSADDQCDVACASTFAEHGGTGAAT